MGQGWRTSCVCQVHDALQDFCPQNEIPRMVGAPSGVADKKLKDVECVYVALMDAYGLLPPGPPGPSGLPSGGVSSLSDLMITIALSSS